MKIEKRVPATTNNRSKTRKMVHIKNATHEKILQLSFETRIPITDIVDMLLTDALSRVQVIEPKKGMGVTMGEEKEVQQDE